MYGTVPVPPRRGAPIFCLAFCNCGGPSRSSLTRPEAYPYTVSHLIANYAHQNRVQEQLSLQNNTLFAFQEQPNHDVRVIGRERRYNIRRECENANV